MASVRVARALADPALPRVAVSADQCLVAESVCAALTGRGHDVAVLRWPTDTDQNRGTPERGLRARRSTERPPGVALLLSDLTRAAQVGRAQTLVRRLDVPWLVLAGSADDSAWGALYEAGAAMVAPLETTDLDTTCVLLTDLRDGHTPIGAARRRELIRFWRSRAQRQGALTQRLSTLTGREEEILQQLYQGLAVRSIAAQSDVTESTVRSQVKAILRKLEVRSQIAAVAAYQEIRSSEGDRHPASVQLGGRTGATAPDGISANMPDMRHDPALPAL